MAVSALVTAIGPTLNCYCSLAVANQYHADRPPADTAWEDADTNERSAALLWATKLIDAEWVWTGLVADVNQPLQWPRWGMYLRNGLQLIATDVIPLELQQATAELARQLLVEDRAADSDIDAVGLQSLTAGPVSLNFRGGGTMAVIPNLVASLIPQHWGYPRSQRTNMRPLVRS